MADRQEPTFETIEELLRDKSIKFSMLAGKSPVLERVKEELTKYWEEEANKGRSIEEFARFNLIGMIVKSLLYWCCNDLWEILFNLVILVQSVCFRAEGLPDLADLVVYERQRRGAAD